MAEFAFVDCEVPVSKSPGQRRRGARRFLRPPWSGSVCILASHLGAMQRMLETSVKYAKERHQFGQPIGQFAPISDKIAEMDIRLETLAPGALQGGLAEESRESNLCRSFDRQSLCGRCLHQDGLDAIQIHGGYGYMTEYQIERELRDAISGKIYSGTTEIQKKIIAGFHGL